MHSSVVVPESTGPVRTSAAWVHCHASHLELISSVAGAKPTIPNRISAATVKCHPSHLEEISSVAGKKPTIPMTNRVSAARVHCHLSHLELTMISSVAKIKPTMFGIPFAVMITQCVERCTCAVMVHHGAGQMAIPSVAAPRHTILKSTCAVLARSEPWGSEAVITPFAEQMELKTSVS